MGWIVQNMLNRLHQFVRDEGFAQHAGDGLILPILPVRLTSDYKDWDMSGLRVSSKKSNQLMTCNARHHGIAKYQGRLLIRSKADRRGITVAVEDGKMHLEDQRHDFADLGVIIDDQHHWFLHVHREVYRVGARKPEQMTRLDEP